jgi:hypothetical protein
MNIVSKTARKEIVEALRARYGKATKLEKGLILGEFTAVSSYCEFRRKSDTCYDSSRTSITIHIGHLFRLRSVRDSEIRSDSFPDGRNGVRYGWEGSRRRGATPEQLPVRWPGQNQTKAPVITMARKLLSMRPIKDILRLKHQHGLSVREVARSCGLPASTVGDYLHRATAAGLGWPLPTELSEEQLQAKLLGGATVPVTSPTTKAVPDWPHLREELRKRQR